MLPRLYDEIERVRGLLGRDFSRYGLEANRAVLATFLRYAHEQGLTARRLEPDELFVPSTREDHVV